MPEPGQREAEVNHGDADLGGGFYTTIPDAGRKDTGHRTSLRS